MINQLLEAIVHFLALTLRADVLFNIVPIFFATIAIILYYQKYEEEIPGWDSFFANSLVLLFVALSLFSYIYQLDTSGFYNFFDNGLKTFSVFFLLAMSFILTKFNFEHLLPKRVAKITSSPITINLIAYAVILFVCTPREPSWISVFALFILVVIFSIILLSIGIPLHKIIIIMQKEREKDELMNIKEEEHQLRELKKSVRERSIALNKVKRHKVEHSRDFNKKLLKYLKE